MTVIICSPLVTITMSSPDLSDCGQLSPGHARLSQDQVGQLEDSSLEAATRAVIHPTAMICITHDDIEPDPQPGSSTLVYQDDVARLLECRERDCNLAEWARRAASLIPGNLRNDCMTPNRFQ